MIDKSKCSEHLSYIMGAVYFLAPLVAIKLA
jgi:hypothetical protein